MRKQLRFIGDGNPPCNNDENNSDQKIYAYMAHIYDNEECTSGMFGDISQLTDWSWILEQRAI